MQTKIRVLLIDDQEIFRLGLRIGLRQFDDISLEWEAGDGPTGLALAEKQKPDVAMVDIRLPGMDGIEVAERLQKICPETRIMLISGSFDDEAIIRGVQLGVAGIIAKTDSPIQFAFFIRRVNNGVFTCSTPILMNILPTAGADVMSPVT